MEKQKRTKLKNEGITLIALVITIIVLLILAGVSIAMLTGENGILTQAQTAKEETERAKVIEEVQTEVMGKQAEEATANLDKTEVKTILDEYFEAVPDDFTLDTELQTKDEYGDYQILVSEVYGGTLEEKPITVGELTDEQKKELYGAYVTNYECSSNDAVETTAPGKWMIFHIDDDNIYLIASDYITEVPPAKGVQGGNTPSIGSDNSYPRGVNFSNILNDYAGSADVSDIGKELNRSYFIDNPSFTSTNNNMKSVAYMLDTDAWSGFKGADADYAIGGPTVELLFESYNKKYGTNYLAQASNSTGYQISNDGDSSWSNAISGMLSTSDPTYVINSSNNASGMLLASPSASSTYNVMLVGYNGNVTHNAYYYPAIGFRPLVSLVSDLQLKKTGDNTYEIIK